MVQKHRSLSTGAALSAALLLSGCSLFARQPEPETEGGASSLSQNAPAGIAPVPVAPTPPSPPPRPQPVPRENRLSPATQSLVTQAHTLQAHGDLDAASSTLDRALRIEPSNPLLWVELGRVRLAESDAHQSETCARKALALASGDPSAQSRAGHLLVDALRAQGRNPEAQEVAARPYMH